MLGKLKDTFDKGVAAVSVKSESMVESSRIRTAISSMQKSMEAAVDNLGAVYYNSWIAGAVDQDSLEEICRKIQKMNGEIADMRAKLEQIKQEESQILGSQKQPRIVAGDGNSRFCSSCGKPMSAGSAFCPNCGAPAKP